MNPLAEAVRDAAETAAKTSDPRAAAGAFVAQLSGWMRGCVVSDQLLGRNTAPEFMAAANAIQALYERRLNAQPPRIYPDPLDEALNSGDGVYRP